MCSLWWSLAGSAGGLEWCSALLLFATFHPGFELVRFGKRPCFLQQSANGSRVNSWHSSTSWHHRPSPLSRPTSRFAITRRRLPETIATMTL